MLLNYERTQSAFLSVNDSNIQNNGNKVKVSKRNLKNRKRMCNRIQEVELQQYALRYKETALSIIK